MLNNLLLLYFIAKLTIIDTARILAVFPTASISHHIVFRVLTNELVRRGHEVVVITTDPAFPNGKTPTNLTEIDVHDISYSFLHEKIMEAELVIGRKVDRITLQNSIIHYFRILEVQIKSAPVQELIRQKRQFDILLIEAYMRPAILFSYLFKAPVILVSSFGASLDNLDAIGAPTHPILYPTIFDKRSYYLSTWDKLQEYFYYLQYKYLEKHFERLENEILQRICGSNVPSVTELIKNVQMLFLNVHPIWMDNQPMPPNVILIGRLHQKPVRDLPEDLKSYLDSSKHGVIYVSFGTNVNSYLFTPERLKVITEALSELPYDILFKWNEDHLPGISKNIKISKWFPQTDILRHPNVKVFIMQGGLQSTDEAITAGVPLICIPMIGDQWYNADKYVQLKIGINLEFLTLTKSGLKNAIETVVSNNSYRENINKLREQMNDQPQPPLECAIWWIEYVLRHGGARHLRTPAAHMSWTEYYELELIAVVLTCLFISTIMGLFIVILLWRYGIKFISSNVKEKIF